MKSQVIFLSMILGSALLAEKNAAQPAQEDCRGCCCVTCPTCVPQPKKCINCECYSPPFYDLQCAFGVSAEVDIFAWYAREANLSYGMEFQAKQVNSIASTSAASLMLVSTPSEHFYLNGGWKPGFRVGIGWNTSCDGWDLGLLWTYYHNKRCNTVSVSNFGVIGTGTGANTNVFLPGVGQSALLNPWINAAFNYDAGGALNFDQIKAKWLLTLNEIDLLLGRKYWLSRCFAMRPFAGLRGGWTRTTFKTESSRNQSFTPSISLVFEDQFKNRLWGVGFLSGFEAGWYFVKNIALFADFDGALLWGQFKGMKKEAYNSTQVNSTINSILSYCNKFNGCFYKMSPIIDMGIGIRWEQSWGQDRFRTDFDFGWEHHVWFSHGQRIKTISSDQLTVTGATPTDSNIFTSFSEEIGDLTFGGFVFRARFDF